VRMEAVNAWTVLIVCLLILRRINYRKQAIELQRDALFLPCCNWLSLITDNLSSSIGLKGRREGSEPQNFSFTIYLSFVRILYVIKKLIYVKAVSIEKLYPQVNCWLKFQSLFALRKPSLIQDGQKR
jgi:hypothetical protein